MSPANSSSSHSSAPTSLRSSKSSSIRPGRALRWARLVYYAIFAPTFVYSLWVQIVVMKGPGRTPLPASLGFGRDTVFLTFHGNFHCTWYACLCLLNALLDLGTRVRRGKRPRARSRVARLVERITHKWTSILFPLAAFVGIAYYLILHYHPLTRMRAKTIPDYDEKMGLLHMVPLLFVLGDSLLKDEECMKRHGLKRRTALIGICTYGVLYFIWSSFCVFKNGGHWPYPFQRNFTPIQHLLFLLSVLLVAQYLARLGFRLQARIDKRRRRRLARLTMGIPAAGETMKTR